jgi:hypothetical protein
LGKGISLSKETINCHFSKLVRGGESYLLLRGRQKLGQLGNICVHGFGSSSISESYFLNLFQRQFLFEK